MFTYKFFILLNLIRLSNKYQISFNDKFLDLVKSLKGLISSHLKKNKYSNRLTLYEIKEYDQLVDFSGMEKFIEDQHIEFLEARSKIK